MGVCRYRHVNTYCNIAILGKSLRKYDINPYLKYILAYSQCFCRFLMHFGMKPPCFIYFRFHFSVVGGGCLNSLLNFGLFCGEIYSPDIADIALIWGFNIDMDIAKQCTHYLYVYGSFLQNTIELSQHGQIREVVLYL